MAYAKSVVVAFSALGETCQTAGLAHTVHFLHAAGQDFVWVGLMTHIPHYSVVGCVVDVVQGYG